MGLPKTELLTEAEYLAFERAAPERHLYVDGEIFAMAGESPNHGRVSSNVHGLIHAQLRGKSCAALVKDTRVRSGPATSSRRQARGMYSYPDVVVHCCEAHYL